MATPQIFLYARRGVRVHVAGGYRGYLIVVRTAVAAGQRTHAHAALPLWADILKWDISQILQGKVVAFPRAYIPVLRNILKVPVGAEVDKLDVGQMIVPEIAPSSPPPK